MHIQFVRTGAKAFMITAIRAFYGRNYNIFSTYYNDLSSMP